MSLVRQVNTVSFKINSTNFGISHSYNILNDVLYIISRKTICIFDISDSVNPIFIKDYKIDINSPLGSTFSDNKLYVVNSSKPSTIFIIDLITDKIINIPLSISYYAHDIEYINECFWITFHYNIINIFDKSFNFLKRIELDFRPIGIKLINNYVYVSGDKNIIKMDVNGNIINRIITHLDNKLIKYDNNKLYVNVLGSRYFTYQIDLELKNKILITEQLQKYDFGIANNYMYNYDPDKIMIYKLIHDFRINDYQYYDTNIKEIIKFVFLAHYRDFTNSKKTLNLLPFELLKLIFDYLIL